MVCAVEVASVRAEPRHDAEQVTQLLRGEPVLVESAQGDWSKIRTAYDYPGWVESVCLTEVDPGDWLPSPQEGSPVEEARRYLGAPYEWGGMTKTGIDCSGLVHMAYRHLGRLVLRDADQQEAAGVEVSDAELRPGDLITYGEAKADHIAFWRGEGRILHASGRDGVNRVVDEAEPPVLQSRRRRVFRL